MRVGFDLEPRVGDHGAVSSVVRSVAAALLLLSCGAKSGLAELALDAGASVDASVDATVDAPVDSPPDVPIEAEPDPPTVCDDAGPTSVYVITAQSLLYRFDPPSSSFEHIGTAFCESSSQPFSMAVDRGGTAYVVYQDGRIYKVNTQTAACQPTSFATGQLGWGPFGMGFVFDSANHSDTLYVTESSYAWTSKGLAKLDVTSLKLSFVAPYSEPFSNAVELTGTGDGRLYAFGLPAGPLGARLAEVDPSSGALLSTTELALGTENSSFAFAFWGGDFYLFTAPDGVTFSDAHRYRPSDGSLTWVAKAKATVVGAGVSTCAPH